MDANMSDFEFTLCVVSAHESTRENVEMLPADQLFFEGKLRPLNEAGDKSQLASGSSRRIRDADDEADVPAAIKCSQQVLFHECTAAPCLGIPNGLNAPEYPAKTSDLMVIPMSPKAPGCSIKLKHLFGFKKLTRSCCSCGMYGDANVTSFAPAKSAWWKVANAEKVKHRSAPRDMQHSARLPVDKGAQFSLQLIDPHSRYLASEPLLGCCEDVKQKVISLRPCCPGNVLLDSCSARGQKCSEHRMKMTSSVISSSHAAHLACKQRCYAAKFDSLPTDTMTEDLSLSGRSEDGNKYNLNSASYKEIRICNKEKCWETRSLMQHVNTSRVAALRAHGSSCVIRNEANRVSKSQNQAALRTARSGSRSLNVHREAILEGCNSYSPKSLQRKYDQLKIIRQREGRRLLERSSSHNGSVHKVAISPVLNVPIVCMSRSKSASHARDSCDDKNLFSISKRKNHELNARVASALSTGKQAALALV